MRLKISALLILAVFLVGTISTSQSFQPAFATSSNLADVCTSWLGGSYVGTTCTVSTSGGSIAVGNELVIPSGTTLVISNNADNGISSFGTIANSGTITVANSGSSSNGIFNGGILTNNLGATIAVVNSGTNSFGITNEGTITNSGTITVTNTGTDTTGIDNLFGTINQECSGTYSGNSPTGTSITDQCTVCPSPPSLGDWSITSDCAITGIVVAPNNIHVNAVLTIKNGGSLDVNFASKFLMVHSGSKIIVKSGGEIF